MRSEIKQKQNLLFIGFDILLMPAAIVLIIYSWFIVEFIITGVLGLICGITSLFLIKKFDLELGKYNFLYVGSIIVSVIYRLAPAYIDSIRNYLDYVSDVDVFTKWIIFLLPTILLPIILTLAVKKIRSALSCS